MFARSILGSLIVLTVAFASGDLLAQKKGKKAADLQQMADEIARIVREKPDGTHDYGNGAKGYSKAVGSYEILVSDDILQIRDRDPMKAKGTSYFLDVEIDGVPDRLLQIPDRLTMDQRLQLGQMEGNLLLSHASAKESFEMDRLGEDARGQVESTFGLTHDDPSYTLTYLSWKDGTVAGFSYNPAHEKRVRKDAALLAKVKKEWSALLADVLRKLS